MKKTISILLAAAAVAACTRDPSPPVPSSEAQEVRSPHRISRGAALDELDRFLAEVGEPSTRSGGRRIRAVEALLSRTLSPATRSDSLSFADTLLWLVNFDDSMGFALLAADSRLKYPLYIVAERGNISSADFLPDEPSPGRPLTREEADWLNDTIDDTPFTPYPDFPSMFRGLFGRTITEGALKFRPYGDTPRNGGEPGGGGGSRPEEGEEPDPVPDDVYDTEWNTIELFGPYLRNAWHQRTPYNMYCPDRGGNPALAGCVPIAVAHIVNYHRFPEYITDKQIEWFFANMAGNIYRPVINDDSDSLLAYHHAATAVRAIGHLCSVDYGASNSSSNAAKAKDCFGDMGYRHVEKYNKFRSRVIEGMIYNGKPVFITGKRKWVNIGRGSGGHAWVIDGLLKRERGTGKYYLYQSLLHCSFGWPSRAGNGYYNHDFFDTGAPIDYDDTVDNPNAGVEDANTYKHHFRIVTYDLP